MPATPTPGMNSCRIILFLACTTALSAADITIDFSANTYPAIPKKIGYNAEWGEESLKTSNYPEGSGLKPDEIAALRAEAAAAPIVAGLIEMNHFTDTPAAGDAYNDASGAIFGPNPLLSRDIGGNVVVATDANLTSLRASAQSRGLINLLQIAGTPTVDDVFTLDTSFMPDTGGNWYPLPISGQLSDFADGLGDFVALVQSTDDAPTMVCFWQEPDHTISGYFPGYPLGSTTASYDEYQRIQGLGTYIEFFKQAGSAVRAANRDIVITGVQQNASSGVSPGGVIDGAAYQIFAALWTATEATDSTTYPLDYITVQNYKGEKSDEIIQNSRWAFYEDRFNTAPLFMNEFHFNKEDSFAMSYDTDAGVSEFLTYVNFVLQAPDTAYALVKRNIFVQTDTLAYEPLRFFGTMPVPQRGFTSTNAAIEGFATGDDSAATALLWNTTGSGQTVSLDLNNFPTTLQGIGTPLRVTVWSGGESTEPVTQYLTTDDYAVTSLTIPAYGLVEIYVTPPSSLGAGDFLVDAKYARHIIWTDRLGFEDEGVPHGEGHFDQRSSSLIASVDANSAAVGLAAVVLKDSGSAFDTTGFKLRADISISGTLPGSSATAVLGLRVDYVTADSAGLGYDTLGTVFYYHEDFASAGPWTSLSSNGWQAPHATITLKNKDFTDGFIIMQVENLAPSAWLALDDDERRVMVSLILADTESPVTIVARLSDPAP